MQIIEMVSKKDGSLDLIVKIGNAEYQYPLAEWVKLAEQITEENLAHLTPVAADEGYCQHDWSFPPKYCPVCEKRVPVIRLRR